MKKIIFILISIAIFAISCDSEEKRQETWLKSVANKSFVDQDGKPSIHFDEKSQIYSDNTWLNLIGLFLQFQYDSSPKKTMGIYSATIPFTSDKIYFGFELKKNNLYMTTNTATNAKMLDWKTAQLAGTLAKK